MKHIISVRNLTKQYYLYNGRMQKLVSLLFGAHTGKTFNALKGINFDITPGECVGIIGKNGSGKSTLLKVLTGVCTPTEGTASINGSVSALLELGAGFNPELTGIENIYFYGHINGRSRQEIDSSLDKIVSFADIGDFIRQPVKSYSSGMFARLAFSVAINMNPDILIVDEALSVGDLKFQRKCLREMEKIKDSGKTVIFVSHDTNVINNFCSRVIWINDGEIKAIGNPTEVTKMYTSYMAYNSESQKKYSNVETEKDSEWQNMDTTFSFGEGKIQITGVRINSSLGLFRTSANLETEISIRALAHQAVDKVGFGIMLKDYVGNPLFTVNNYIYSKKNVAVPKNQEVVGSFKFKFPPLQQGQYVLSTTVSEGTQLDHVQHHWIHDAVIINVLPSDKDIELGCTLNLDKKDVHFETKS